MLTQMLNTYIQTLNTHANTKYSNFARRNSLNSSFFSNVPSFGMAGPNIGTSYDLVTDTLGGWGGHYT